MFEFRPNRLLFEKFALLQWKIRASHSTFWAMTYTPRQAEQNGES